jgi:hypothetical protein
MALMSVVETLRICQLVAVPLVSVPVRGARDIVFDLASRQNLYHFRKRLRRPREALLVARDVPLGWIASSRQKIRYAWNFGPLLKPSSNSSSSGFFGALECECGIQPDRRKYEPISVETVVRAGQQTPPLAHGTFRLH